MPCTGKKSMLIFKPKKTSYEKNFYHHNMVLQCLQPMVTATGLSATLVGRNEKQFFAAYDL
jgi:hypothetical protein